MVEADTAPGKECRQAAANPVAAFNYLVSIRHLFIWKYLWDSERVLHNVRS